MEEKLLMTQKHKTWLVSPWCSFVHEAGRGGGECVTADSPIELDQEEGEERERVKR